MNIWPKRQEQTQKPVVLKTRGNLLRTLPLVLPWYVRLLLPLMLLGLVLLLTACGTLSTTPTEPARNPQPPQLSEPLPQEHYSKSAAERIKSWAERLMGM